MSKERYNQIIDEAYENYILSYKDGHEFYEDEEIKRSFTQEEFINKCKSNPEFSEKWELKIEGRELDLDERKDIWNKDNFGQDMSWHNMVESDVTILLNEDNIPTKLITLTYNNETIESYE